MGVEVKSSRIWLLACTEALCTSRVGVQVAQSWFLKTCRGLWSTPQKIQSTLTGGCEHLRKCRSAGVLPREECILTPPV